MSEENQITQLLNKNSQNDECQKDKKLKQVYFCSCGKQYQSYAAIYLHFRARHNIKLSTKATEKRRKVKIDGNIIKIIYKASHVKQSASKKRKRELSLLEQYYEEEQQKIFEYKQPSNLKIKKIKNCVIQYLSKSKGQYSFLYEKLLNYFIIESHSLNIPQSAFKRQNIPYLFNNFTMGYLTKNDSTLIIGSQQWNDICLELAKFSDWMYQKNYTKILVMPNK